MYEAIEELERLAPDESIPYLQGLLIQFLKQLSDATLTISNPKLQELSCIALSGLTWRLNEQLEQVVDEIMALTAQLLETTHSINVRQEILTLLQGVNTGTVPNSARCRPTNHSRQHPHNTHYICSIGSQ